jgi:hypothetical protein
VAPSSGSSRSADRAGAVDALPGVHGAALDYPAAVCNDPRRGKRKVAFA